MKRIIEAWASLWATVLLGLVYYCALGPACALARALGWDPLALEGPGRRTYWRRRDAGENCCSERTW